MGVLDITVKLTPQTNFGHDETGKKGRGWISDLYVRSSMSEHLCVKNWQARACVCETSLVFVLLCPSLLGLVPVVTGMSLRVFNALHSTLQLFIKAPPGGNLNVLIKTNLELAHSKTLFRFLLQYCCIFLKQFLQPRKHSAETFHCQTSSEP